MIPQIESDDAVNRALQSICDLSPTARNNIELELYKQNSDSDGSTNTFILDDVFGDLMSDLESIGVTVSFDYNDVVAEQGKLFEFLKVLTYLMPNTLQEILKTQSDIRNCVEHILNGSLGEDETLLQTYLSELGGLEGQLPLVPELTSILDQLYPVMSQTEQFSDYMKNIFDLSTQTKLLIESDDNQHKAYRDVIREMIGRLSDAVNVYQEYDAYVVLLTLQSTIIQDLIAPVNFMQYQYLFLTNQKDLPEDLQESYKKSRYHYTVSHPWCMDYYLVRNIRDLSKTEFRASPIWIYCFLYALMPTKQLFQEALKTADIRFRNELLEAEVLKLYQEGDV